MFDKYLCNFNPDALTYPIPEVEPRKLTDSPRSAKTLSPIPMQIRRRSSRAHPYPKPEIGLTFTGVRVDNAEPEREDPKTRYKRKKRQQLEQLLSDTKTQKQQLIHLTTERDFYENDRRQVSNKLDTVLAENHQLKLQLEALMRSCAVNHAPVV